MTRYLVILTAFALAISEAALGQVLRGGDQLIDPSHSVETADIRLTLDYLPDWLIESELRHFWPKTHNGIDYSAYTFVDKTSGYKRTTLIDIEGGAEPYFDHFSSAEYCGIDLFFVTVEREMSRYGGATRWITTYIFRADTFDFMQEFYGTPYDVTRFDSRWVPEVDSLMAERFLVSCIPASRGRPFDFGLIDRKKLYGPDWCGAQGARCVVKAGPT